MSVPTTRRGSCEEVFLPQGILAQLEALFDF